MERLGLECDAVWDAPAPGVTVGTESRDEIPHTNVGRLRLSLSPLSSVDPLVELLVEVHRRQPGSIRFGGGGFGLFSACIRIR